MSPDAALAQISATANADKATEMARYHKVPRQYLGVANPQIDTLTKEWRQSLDLDARLKLASDLWANGHPRGPHRRRQTADPGPHPPR